MKIYINYADQNFQKQQSFALIAAKYIGNFDKIIGYSPDDIEETFYSKYSSILKQKRGGGYWLWKPYLIDKTLTQLSEEDYLFYSDSGAFFLKNVDHLIKELNKYDQDIMGFELPLIEEQWTKKELLLNLDCSDEIYYDSNQILASFMLIKNTKRSKQFFKTFLEASCNEINITDKYLNSVEQTENFIDHRHDQSIFSLLYKKNGLRPFKDPSQLGKHPSGYSAVNQQIPKLKLVKLKNGRKYRIKSYIEDYSMVLFVNKAGAPLKSLLTYLIKYFLHSLRLYQGLVR